MSQSPQERRASHGCHILCCTPPSQPVSRAVRQVLAETHGPLARRHLQALGARRYTQVHTIDDPMNGLLQAMRGITVEPFDGIAVIVGEREKLVEATGTEEGQRAMTELLEDEKNFIDFSRSAIWIAQENVIFESK
ncbi:MAG: EthD domain-containing protein [Dehalococcoidia bacterium]|nr:EthD domain-containing protein [Dehalococcoidia bacterium]